MGRRARCAAIVLCCAGAVALGGCGDETAATPTQEPASSPPASPLASEAPPVVVVDGEVQLGCGGSGTGWPASVMAEGLPGLLSADEARATFLGILDDPDMGGEAELSLFRDGVDVEYRVLRGDDDSLEVGLGRWTARGPTEGAIVLGLSREGDRWVADGWGSCTRLGPLVADGAIWVEARHARPVAGDPAAVDVALTETACTSSRDPSPYLHEPFVVETDDTVTIYATSTPPRGAQHCPGNPSVQRTVTLDEPLGQRVVLDGSRYPPLPISAPQPDDGP